MLHFQIPSKLNGMDQVLYEPRATTEVRCTPPENDRGVHDAVVTEVHAVLKQLSNIVSEAVEVKFHPPKPSPLIVTVDPPVFARFALSRLLTLTNGAEPIRKASPWCMC